MWDCGIYSDCHLPFILVSVNGETDEFQVILFLLFKVTNAENNYSSDLCGILFSRWVGNTTEITNGIQIIHVFLKLNYLCSYLLSLTWCLWKNCVLLNIFHWMWKVQWIKLIVVDSWLDLAVIRSFTSGKIH